MTKTKDLLIVLTSLGLPTTAIWGVAVKLWTDTTWATPEHTRILLGSAAFLGTALVGCIWWIVRLIRRPVPPPVMAPVKNFQDYCTWDSRLGVYKHETKPGYFCGTCTPAQIESPLAEKRHGWQCLVHHGHWHDNPDDPYVSNYDSTGKTYGDHFGSF